MRELKDSECQLCDMLSQKPCDVPVGRVPSNQQLAHLEENVLRLEREKVHVILVNNVSVHLDYLFTCLYLC